MRKRASFWWRSKLCPTHNVPSSNVMSIWGMNIILIWGENWPYHHIVSPTKCYEASERDQRTSREQNCSLLGPHNIPRLKWGTSKVQAPKRRNSGKHKADREGASKPASPKRWNIFCVFSNLNGAYLQMHGAYLQMHMQVNKSTSAGPKRSILWSFSFLQSKMCQMVHYWVPIISSVLEVHALDKGNITKCKADKRRLL